ncbi:MAG TPA: 30S ribosomal protein S15 [Phycisphaerales bacterium]|nr:30S ribosomal protein S15 [Phycisphaerales bacterium]
MALAAEVKTSIIREYQRDAKDAGSPEVQIALLTGRIAELTDHLKNHVKDHAARRGLVMMVGKRNRLLHYLSGANNSAYQKVIKQLGLRK